MELHYLSKDEWALEKDEIEGKLGERVTSEDFNEALRDFDEGLKEENKKTYEYI